MTVEKDEIFKALLHGYVTESNLNDFQLMLFPFIPFSRLDAGCVMFGGISSQSVDTFSSLPLSLLLYFRHNNGVCSGDVMLNK